MLAQNVINNQVLEPMTTTNTPGLQIKGIREGLLVTLGEGEWQDVFDHLINHIDQGASFFQGARMALDIGNRVLHAAEMGLLRDRLSDKGVSLWAVISQSPVSEQTAQMLGLATRISTPRPERTIKSLDTNLEGENAVLVHRTVRSGFKISSHGHVVIVGDVNPGAEISAGGNVVVWGKLKGNVQAGLESCENVVICALEMEPGLLRIGNEVFRSNITGKHKGPEIAFLKDGQVVIEPWLTKSH